MRFFSVILLFLVSVNIGFGQTFIVEGRVCDKNDKEDLVGATVRLLSLPDSGYVSASSAYHRTVRQGEEEITSSFTVTLPSRTSSYLMEVSATGYDKEFITIEPSKYGERERRADLSLILLSRRAHDLKEMTVTSSRIKFFNQGDTVVFNADAFQLTNGSMLDALVSQLPGVELKSNGQILYNGKYIESLLLDGKHFFNGNNQLMLENIGAYAVKNVKIYDKAGDASDFAGRNLGNDRQLVMDVKLKKEYSTGLILNAEAGGGTDDRYLGRLFGMWFNSDTRLTIYGNANNLNDDRKPGRSDTWKPEQLKSGVSKSNTGGFDYVTDKKAAGWKALGNIQVGHETLDDETSIYRTNFLAGGDTYDRILRENKSKTLRISTNHELYLKRRMFDLTVTPFFEYNNRQNTTTTASITSASVYTSDYINRTVNENHNRAKTVNAGLTANSRLKVKGSSNILRLGVFGNYNNLRDNRFNHYSIEYGENTDMNVFFDRYFKNYPNHNSRLGATAGYNRRLAEGVSLELTYRYTHSTSKSNSILYNLQGADADIDYRNSYASQYRNNDHTVSPLLIFEKGQWDGQVNVPLTMAGRRLDYQ